MAKLLMGFVGDMLVNRADPIEAFSKVRDLLKVPQILFGNLEGAYTDNPLPVPNAPEVQSAPAHNLNVYADVGFNVLSLANNHILDAGYEAMLATRSRLRDQSIRTCGVGDSLADAREPAILEVGGIRVAFLAYASVFRVGYEARSARPGLAPMRAYNFWRDPFPSLYDPGRNPIVTTVPDEADLANLTEDIRRARGHADLVVASFHWGDYTRPFHLTDHEIRTAHYCIDQGAHMVVGHHHHVLRGMEWYKGRPIMYGLGHFVFDLPLGWTEEEYDKRRLDWDPAGYWDQSQGPYTFAPRKGWPLLPMHEDTRMTILAYATSTRDGIDDIGFLPCRLTPDGLINPLRVESAGSTEVVNFLETCNRSQRLKSSIVPSESMDIAGYQTLRVIPN